jgi:hypothetical protein
MAGFLHPERSKAGGAPYTLAPGLALVFPGLAYSTDIVRSVFQVMSTRSPTLT